MHLTTRIVAHVHSRLCIVQSAVQLASLASFLAATMNSHRRFGRSKGNQSTAPVAVPLGSEGRSFRGAVRTRWKAVAAIQAHNTKRGVGCTCGRSNWKQGKERKTSAERTSAKKVGEANERWNQTMAGGDPIHDGSEHETWCPLPLA